MRCLITGFAPVCGRKYNRSWDAVLAATSTPLSGCELWAVQLPVSFSWAPEVLRQEIRRLSPDVVLMLGESPAGDRIKLERTAVNMMDAVMPDCDGSLPDEALIDPSLPAAFLSPLPLKSIRDAVAAENIAVKISNSCGLYVCNRVYFEAMRLRAEMHAQMPALFVHIPRENMTLCDIARAVRTIASFLIGYEQNR